MPKRKPEVLPDSSDSSEDYSSGEDAPAVDVSSLQTPATEDVKTKRRLQQASGGKPEAKGNGDRKPGIIYLGRIPRGFYEDQMRAYFSQFGDITRLRLSRNRKTGASRHYAFIEFESADVAAIVAETMHNYLLLGHLLQCHVLDDEQVHPRLWIGANKRLRPYPTTRIAREKCNSDKTPKAKANISRRLRRKEVLRRERIAAMGIEYDFKGYQR